MGLGESILAELTHETQTTRRMLERLPDGKADWKPHAKSMSLGRLAMHLAELPGFFTAILEGDELVGGRTAREPRVARSSAEALEVFDAATAKFAAKLAGCPDARLLETWRFRVGERVVMELPRVAAIRALVLSHSIHHRGQLTVYLRLLDVPVPSSYGPTADEKP
jgi:uncharacterized damage-inducible protein DinB